MSVESAVMSEMGPGAPPGNTSYLGPVNHALTQHSRIDHVQSNNVQGASRGKFGGVW